MRHAAQCGYLAQFEQGKYNAAALEYLALKEPAFHAEVMKKLGVLVLPAAKRSSDAADDFGGGNSQGTSQGPPLKRSRSEPEPSGVERAGFRPGEKPKDSVFQREGRKKLQEEANGALVDFIIGCGLSAHVVASRHFLRYSQILNSSYRIPSRSTFEYSLVPTRAGGIRYAIQKHLKQCRNNGITFDGGKLVKKKFYSVHVTTEDRRPFCMELDDSTGLSMTAEYILELIDKVST